MTYTYLVSEDFATIVPPTGYTLGTNAFVTLDDAVYAAATTPGSIFVYSGANGSADMNIATSADITFSDQVYAEGELPGAEGATHAASSVTLKNFTTSGDIITAGDNAVTFMVSNVIISGTDTFFKLNGDKFTATGTVTNSGTFSITRSAVDATFAGIGNIQLAAGTYGSELQIRGNENTITAPGSITLNETASVSGKTLVLNGANLYGSASISAETVELNGYLQIYGENTVNFTDRVAITGGVIGLRGGATLKNSTVKANITIGNNATTPADAATITGKTDITQINVDSGRFLNIKNAADDDAADKVVMIGTINSTAGNIAIENVELIVTTAVNNRSGAIELSGSNKFNITNLSQGPKAGETAPGTFRLLADSEIIDSTIGDALLNRVYIGKAAGDTVSFAGDNSFANTLVSNVGTINVKSGKLTAKSITGGSLTADVTGYEDESYQLVDADLEDVTVAAKIGTYTAVTKIGTTEGLWLSKSAQTTFYVNNGNSDVDGTITTDDHHIIGYNAFKSIADITVAGEGTAPVYHNSTTEVEFKKDKSYFTGLAKKVYYYANTNDIVVLKGSADGTELSLAGDVTPRFYLMGESVKYESEEAYESGIGSLTAQKFTIDKTLTISGAAFLYAGQALDNTDLNNRYASKADLTIDGTVKAGLYVAPYSTVTVSETGKVLSDYTSIDGSGNISLTLRPSSTVTVNGNGSEQNDYQLKEYQLKYIDGGIVNLNNTKAWFNSIEMGGPNEGRVLDITPYVLNLDNTTLDIKKFNMVGDDKVFNKTEWVKENATMTVSLKNKSVLNVENSKTFNVLDKITIDVDGSTINANKITNAGAITIVNKGEITTDLNVWGSNSGTINVNNGATLSAKLNVSAGSITVDGAILKGGYDLQNASATLTVKGTSTVDINLFNGTLNLENATITNARIGRTNADNDVVKVAKDFTATFISEGKTGDVDNVSNIGSAISNAGNIIVTGKMTAEAITNKIGDDEGTITINAGSSISATSINGGTVVLAGLTEGMALWENAITVSGDYPAETNNFALKYKIGDTVSTDPLVFDENGIAFSTDEKYLFAKSTTNNKTTISVQSNTEEQSVLYVSDDYGVKPNVFTQTIKVGTVERTVTLIKGFNAFDSLTAALDVADASQIVLTGDVTDSLSKAYIKRLSNDYEIVKAVSVNGVALDSATATISADSQYSEYYKDGLLHFMKDTGTASQYVPPAYAPTLTIGDGVTLAAGENSFSKVFYFGYDSGNAIKLDYKGSFNNFSKTYVSRHTEATVTGTVNGTELYLRKHGKLIVEGNGEFTENAPQVVVGRLAVMGGTMTALNTVVVANGSDGLEVINRNVDTVMRPEGAAPEDQVDINQPAEKTVFGATNSTVIISKFEGLPGYANEDINKDYRVILDNSTMKATGEVKNYGTFDVIKVSTLLSADTISNYGTLNIGAETNDTGSNLLSAKAISNAGTINAYAGSTITATGTGAEGNSSNSGTINAYGATLNVTGVSKKFENSGTIYLKESAVLNTQTFSNSGSITVDKSTVTSGNKITVSGTFTAQNDAIVSGFNLTVRRGAFSATNSTVKATDIVISENGYNASYTKVGGSLTAGTITTAAEGTFNGNGTIDVTSIITNNGVFALTGGSLTAKEIVNTSGSITVSGTDTTVKIGKIEDESIVGGLTGTINVANGATLSADTAIYRKSGSEGSTVKFDAKVGEGTSSITVASGAVINTDIENSNADLKFNGALETLGTIDNAGSITVTGNVTAATVITNVSGSKFTVGGTSELNITNNLTGTITLANDATVAATVKGGTLLVENGSTNVSLTGNEGNTAAVTNNGELTLAGMFGDITNHNTIEANSNIMAKSIKNNLMSSTITATEGDIVATNGSIVNNSLNNEITAGGSIKAFSSITNYGSINAGGKIKAIEGDIVASNGSITNNNYSEITAGGEITASNGIMNSAGGEITAGGSIKVFNGDITNSGSINAGGEITASNGIMNSAGGEITAGGSIKVFNGDITNSGRIENSSGNIEAKNIETQNSDAKIIANYGNINAANSIENSGSMTAKGDGIDIGDIVATNNITNSGRIETTGTGHIKVTNGDITNNVNGKITANFGRIIANEIKNYGSIKTISGNIKANNSIENYGSIEAEYFWCSITTDGNLTNSGTITTTGSIVSNYGSIENNNSIKAGSITTTTGEIENKAGSINANSIEAAKITNYGEITAQSLNANIFNNAVAGTITTANLIGSAQWSDNYGYLTVNGGTLTAKINNFGTLNVNNAQITDTSIDIQSGSFTVSGESSLNNVTLYRGALSLAGATISCSTINGGNNPGFVQIASATFKGTNFLTTKLENIGSLTIDANIEDCLVVTGDFTNSGTITIDISDIDLDEPGDSMRIVSVNGTIANSGSFSVKAKEGDESNYQVIVQTEGEKGIYVLNAGGSPINKETVVVDLTLNPNEYNMGDPVQFGGKTYAFGITAFQRADHIANLTDETKNIKFKTSYESYGHLFLNHDVAISVTKTDGTGIGNRFTLESTTIHGTEDKATQVNFDVLTANLGTLDVEYSNLTFSDMTSQLTAKNTEIRNSSVKFSSEVEINGVLTLDQDSKIEAKQGEIFMITNDNMSSTINGKMYLGNGANAILGTINGNGTIYTDIKSRLNLNAGDSLVNTSIDVTGLTCTGSLKQFETIGGTFETTAKNLVKNSDSNFNKYFTIVPTGIEQISGACNQYIAKNDGDIVAATTHYWTVGDTVYRPDEIVVKGTSFNNATYFSKEITNHDLGAKQQKNIGVRVEAGTFQKIAFGGEKVDIGGDPDDIIIWTRKTDLNLTIENATFVKNLLGGDNIKQGGVYRRNGDSNLTIKDGFFGNDVAAGLVFNPNEEHMDDDAIISVENTNLTISGGVFKGFVYGGNYAINKTVSSALTVKGNSTVTLIAEGNNIEFQKSLFVGSYGYGKVKGETELVIKGEGTIKVGDKIWGGSSGDYIIQNSYNAYISPSMGDYNQKRNLTFTGFNGEIDCNNIKAFSNVNVLNKTSATLNDTVNLSDVSNWKFDFGSTLSGSFENDFSKNAQPTVSDNNELVYSGDTLFLNLADANWEEYADGWTLFDYISDSAADTISGFSSVKADINGTDAINDDLTFQWDEGRNAWTATMGEDNYNLGIAEITKDDSTRNAMVLTHTLA